MKKIIVALLVVVLTQNICSQENYTVGWGNSTYDTLSTYTSILYELLPEPYMGFSEVEINFGFSFPFFDTYFTSVNIDANGIGYFSNSEHVYQLFAFEGGYQNHYNLPIFSDWRYVNETVNEIGVLKIEWRNVGIYDDIESSNPTDHRINFQMWLFENGIIEYHFGETDLTNTPFYSETNGFIWEDGESYGPWIGIINDDSESEVYFLSGTNDDIILITDDDYSDIFYDVPVNGQYFRFTPDEITSIQTEQISRKFDIMIYPNPVYDYFSLKIKNEDNSLLNKTEVKIFSTTGKLVKSLKIKSQIEKINVSHLPSGVYFVRILNENNEGISLKIVKK